MLEWFIVAFISMPATDQIKIKLMQESFSNKAACVNFMQKTPGIVNDIHIIEPRNTGMWFECLDTYTIKKLKTKQELI